MINTSIHKCIQTCIHTHTYMHAYMHTYMRMYIHTYTQPARQTTYRRSRGAEYRHERAHDSVRTRWRQRNCILQLLRWMPHTLTCRACDSCIISICVCTPWMCFPSFDQVDCLAHPICHLCGPCIIYFVFLTRLICTFTSWLCRNMHACAYTMFIAACTCMHAFLCTRLYMSTYDFSTLSELVQS